MLLALALAGLTAILRRGGTARSGWLLLAMGGGTATAFLAHALAIAGLAHEHRGRGVQALVWLAIWLMGPALRPVPNPLGIADTAAAASLIIRVALLTITGYTGAVLVDLIAPFLAAAPGLDEQVRAPAGLGRSRLQ